MSLSQKIKKIYLAGMAAAALSASAGCVSTDTNEMAVVYCKFWCGNDKAPEVVSGGQTKIYVPFKTKQYIINTEMQTLEMSLDFKTREGNDIEQKITVAWKVDTTKLQKLVEEVGTDIEGIQERYLRPISRSVIRDYLNKLNSQAFYEGQNRFQEAKSALADLQKRFASLAIEIHQVNVKGYTFKDREYQKQINAAENAAQDREKFEKQIDSKKEEWKKKFNIEEGNSKKKIADAEGEKQTNIKSADAYNYQKEQDANASRTEKRTEAEAIRKSREALASSGGDTSVLMEYVNNFNPRSIVVLPCSGGQGLTVQRVDMNQLIAAEASREAADFEGKLAERDKEIEKLKQQAAETADKPKK